MTRITALIADDVPEMRQLLRSTLREFDCEVIFEAHDGTQVLAAIENEMPDILFLDLDMPKMNGLEVLTGFGVLPSLPYTVIISANTSAESAHKCLNLGASVFISKPYTAQKVGEVIKAYCAKRDAALICTALVADDEALMRDLLKNVLGKHQCHVTHAVENGAEAVAYLEQNPAPDLVFLDIDMPVLDGLGALRIIREQKMDVFCAMVSAHSTFENVKNAMSQGADGFLVKPYTEEKIRQVLGKYHSKRKKQSGAS